MKTAIVDEKRRVRIPALKPGQVVAYEEVGNGIVTLTPMEPVKPPGARPAKCRLVKKNGFTVIETDRNVSMETLKELLAELP